MGHGTSTRCHDSVMPHSARPAARPERVREGSDAVAVGTPPVSIGAPAAAACGVRGLQHLPHLDSERCKAFDLRRCRRCGSNNPRSRRECEAVAHCNAPHDNMVQKRNGCSSPVRRCKAARNIAKRGGLSCCSAPPRCRRLCAGDLSAWPLSEPSALTSSCASRMLDARLTSDAPSSTSSPSASSSGGDAAAPGWSKVINRRSRGPYSCDNERI